MADRPVVLRYAPERVLVVKPSSLGDVVHSLPFLHALKSCMPDARIDWVIARGLEGLLEGHPMIKDLIVIDKDRWRRISRAAETLGELRELSDRLKAGGYDLVIDLQGLLRSGLMTKATAAPVRIGFAEAREGSRFFYTHKVTGGRDIHAVDRYLKIAAALGCPPGKVAFPFPEPARGSDVVRDIRDRLKDYIVLVPGARWDTKIWPAELFGRLASVLPLRSVVIGGNADRQRAEEIVRVSGGRAVSLAGQTTIPELVELIRSSRCAITNDSGPMHIAAALDIPVVALFGPTSPVKTGPYGSRHLVLKSERACAPCFKKKCDDIRCMRDISVEMVLAGTKELLQE
ncbi:MAG: lipopolysaccharide heptosyltransferase I [Nitrospiraceae bacterium]|nr:lipopolysaccharide heptosyltransferase I [Nitrospiraceae bacterium]